MLVHINVILWYSLVSIVYGIVGILGFQIVPRKYRGYNWSKKYKRTQGVGWLLVDDPWLVFIMEKDLFSINIGTGLTCIILFVLAMKCNS